MKEKNAWRNEVLQQYPKSRTIEDFYPQDIPNRYVFLCFSVQLISDSDKELYSKYYMFLASLEYEYSQYQLQQKALDDLSMNFLWLLF